MYSISNFTNNINIINKQIDSIFKKIIWRNIYPCYRKEMFEGKKRLYDEFKHIHERLHNFSLDIATLFEDEHEFDLYNWECSFIGPADTPNRDGLFEFDLIFPKKYPIHPPEIVFKTPIYHQMLFLTQIAYFH